MRMKKNVNILVAMLFGMLLLASLAACSTSASGSSGSTGSQGSGQTAGAAATNNSPITVVWYPNESSNTHESIRAEVGKLITQATGRSVEHKPTTDYTIAIESLASGSADIAMSMGAVGYVEAKNRNPEVDVLFVNGDKNGSLDEAKYFAWLCVDIADANQYAKNGSFAIDNIKGKKMSFVSKVPLQGSGFPPHRLFRTLQKILWMKMR